MTNKEFSNGFSTLLNSYGSVAPFGGTLPLGGLVLDEYEKSVYLTMAQDILVKSYFDAQLNPQGQGFDDSQRRQVDFSSLLKVVELQPESEFSGTKMDGRSIVFKLDDDVLYIVNEMLLRLEGSAVVEQFVVKPISYLEYDRQMSKAYSKPLKRQAWRLFQNTSDGFDILSEVVPRKNEDIEGQTWKYKVHYVMRPTPIVLVDLPDGLSVEGVSEATECILNPSMHHDILVKAVELAYRSRAGVVAEDGNNRQDSRQ